MTVRATATTTTATSVSEQTRKKRRQTEIEHEPKRLSTRDYRTGVIMKSESDNRFARDAMRRSLRCDRMCQICLVCSNQWCTVWVCACDHHTSWKCETKAETSQTAIVIGRIAHRTRIEPLLKNKENTIDPLKRAPVERHRAEQIQRKKSHIFLSVSDCAVTA